MLCQWGILQGHLVSSAGSLKIFASSERLRRRANARNVSSRTTLRRLFHIINPVNKNSLSSFVFKVPATWNGNSSTETWSDFQSGNMYCTGSCVSLALLLGSMQASLLRRPSLGSSRNLRGGGRLRDEPKEGLRRRLNAGCPDGKSDSL